MLESDMQVEMSPVLTFLLAAEHILNLKMLHAQYNDDEEGDDDDDDEGDDDYDEEDDEEGDDDPVSLM